MVPFYTRTTPAEWPPFARAPPIAWLLCDHISQPIKQATYIIKPNGFNIPIHVAQIHGINNAKAMTEGVNYFDVLRELDNVLIGVNTIVSHNLNFDYNVLQAEYYRYEVPSSLQYKKQICTMKASTEFCKLPGKGKYPGSFKWPRLDELYDVLFHEPLERKHDAREDVLACAKCFFELKKLGVL